MKRSFGARSALLLPDKKEKLTLPETVGPESADIDLAIAQWCFDKCEAAGLGTDTLPASKQLYVPVKGPIRIRGVLVVQPEAASVLDAPEQRRLLDTFTALIANALERVHFVAVAQESLLKMESERLRTSLLSALSHDLRTPLTALVGLTENLARDLTAADAPQAVDAQFIREQGLRMSRLVDNLLEMARLQSGTATLNKDWQSVEELVGGALKSIESALRGRPVSLDLPADLPLVKCDALLVERVLVNLLENAIKYVPPNKQIGIRVRRDDGFLAVEVWDEGPGIPAGRESRLFDMFARGPKESAVPGVGLGLAICKTIVEAHGGSIDAGNRPSGGARFLFRLPVDPQPPLEGIDGAPE
jgi:two-component system sensor histidine kinase KdpD